MNFFTQLKCAFCPRWSCPARYRIGNRTYYSHLGFISTECPKKLKNYSFLRETEQLNESLTEERLKKQQNRNVVDNGKNEE